MCSRHPWVMDSRAECARGSVPPGVTPPGSSGHPSTAEPTPLSAIYACWRYCGCSHASDVSHRDEQSLDKRRKSRICGMIKQIHRFISPSAVGEN